MAHYQIHIHNNSITTTNLTISPYYLLLIKVLASQTCLLVPIISTLVELICLEPLEIPLSVRMIKVMSFTEEVCQKRKLKKWHQKIINKVKNQFKPLSLSTSTSLRKIMLLPLENRLSTISCQKLRNFLIR
jgi:hypothetical protein